MWRAILKNRTTQPARLLQGKTFSPLPPRPVSMQTQRADTTRTLMTVRRSRLRGERGSGPQQELRGSMFFSCRCLLSELAKRQEKKLSPLPPRPVSAQT